MHAATIQKLGGTALMLGSALFLIYSILFPLLLPVNEMHHDLTTVILNPNWIWIAAVAFTGILLMIFGFTAVYSKLYAESGIVGLLGFIFVVIAYIFQACQVSWEIFLYPVISSNQASMFLFRDFVIQHNSLVGIFKGIAGGAIFIGIILFCIALVRSKSFPKSAGILIFIGAFLYGLGPLLSVLLAIGGIFILSIGCSVLGLSLMKNRAG
jgi:hypothetical protein